MWFKKKKEASCDTVMKDKNNILEIDNLQVYFETESGIVKAVDGVTIDIPKNSTIGIVGESGCGKSVTSLTTMRLLQEPPGKIRGGEIRLNLGDGAIDIAKAYKASATKLVVEYRTNKNGIDVTYRYDGIQEKIVFRFVSFIEPKIMRDKAFIEDLEITSNFNVLPKIEKRAYAKYLGKAGLAYIVDYEVNKSGSGFASFSFQFQ